MWMDFLFLVVVAGISGALGQSIAGRRREGILMSVALGFGGALVGVVLARGLGLPALITVHGFPLVWAILGAALVSALLGVRVRRRRRR